MENLKLYIAETQGIAPDDIQFLRKINNDYLVQFDEDVRGITTIDHEDDEFLLFKDGYFGEVYDIITAEYDYEAIRKYLLNMTV